MIIIATILLLRYCKTDNQLIYLDLTLLHRDTMKKLLEENIFLTMALRTYL